MTTQLESQRRKNTLQNVPQGQAGLAESVRLWEWWHAAPHQLLIVYPAQDPYATGFSCTAASSSHADPSRKTPRPKQPWPSFTRSASASDSVKCNRPQNAQCLDILRVLSFPFRQLLQPITSAPRKQLTDSTKQRDFQYTPSRLTQHLQNSSRRNTQTPRSTHAPFKIFLFTTGYNPDGYGPFWQGLSQIVLPF